CIHPTLPLPRRSINVWHERNNNNTDSHENPETRLYPCKIVQYAVSASGSHAVTASYNKDKLHIDLWELDLESTFDYQTYPSPSSLSTAHIAVAWRRHSILEANELSISWDGSQISLNMPLDTKEWPGIRLYGVSDNTEPNEESKKAPRQLCASTRHQGCGGLLSLIGFAKFTNVSTEEWSDLSERYLACDKMNVFVYSTTDQWKVIYSIQILPSPVNERASSLVSTAKGGSFVLRESPLQLSVWSVESGKRKCVVNTTHTILRYFLSSDGSSIAVSTEMDLFIHSTASGKLLRKLGLESSELDEPFLFFEGDSKILTMSVWNTGEYRVHDASTLQSLGETTVISQESLSVQDIVPMWTWRPTTTGATIIAQSHGSQLDISFMEDSIHHVENDTEQECNPTTADQELELLLSWALEDARAEVILRAELMLQSEVKIRACPHGRTLTVMIDELELRLCPERVFALEHASAFLGAIDWLVAIYHEPTMAVERAILRYLQRHVNTHHYTGGKSLSVVSAICDRWQYYQRNVRDLLKDLFYTLPPKSQGWLPQLRYLDEPNPVGVMLGYARTKPNAIEIIQILIGYCIEWIKVEKDMSYLLYLCEHLDELVARFPDLALRTTRAFAYLEASNRAIVIQHHKIAHTPTLRRFWIPNHRKLYRCVAATTSAVGALTDPLNDNFTEDVFVTYFRLLWTFAPYPRTKDAAHMNSTQQWRMRQQEEYCLLGPKPATDWLRAMYYLVLMHMNPVSHVYIRPRYYSLDILDNPAIEALIQYKWNTFAFAVWLTRFVTECFYYALILIAALLQVYYQEPDSLLGVFVAIIALSCLFLWLEFLQWRDSRYHMKNEPPSRIGDESSSSSVDGQESDREGSRGGTRMLMIDLMELLIACFQWVARGLWNMVRFRKAKDSDMNEVNALFGLHRRRSPYFRSPYNMLDLAMYLLPLATSIHQIVNILNGKEDGVSWDLSYCVVLVSLHMLAELRVHEAVCKYVTIVVQILSEIQVFFVVLAGGVLFFSIAIVHVLHGNANTMETHLQRDGGRYDPLADDLLEKDKITNQFVYKNWPLQIMIMIYFLFTVIFMLNILIALINVAFVKGDDSWRQVWLENRLRYVESAENMSYHIPGFRATFDWFPEKIYYTSTSYQVEQYKKRIKKKDEDIDFSFAEMGISGGGGVGGMSSGTSPTTMAINPKGESGGMGGLGLSRTGTLGTRPSITSLSAEFAENRVWEQLKESRKELIGVKDRLEQQEQVVRDQTRQISGLVSMFEKSQNEMGELRSDIRAILAVMQQLQEHASRE
ncbi:hypothetical protein BGW38_003975, partial [Lunasporangiospora selenospora]